MKLKLPATAEKNQLVDTERTQDTLHPADPGQRARVGRGIPLCLRRQLPLSVWQTS